MAIDILMPALSPTMEKGNLVKWLKAVGDNVAPGDVIAEIETDKATMEVEAVDEGVLEEIVIVEGSEDVPVNSVIARLSGEAAGAGLVSDSSLADSEPSSHKESAEPVPAAARSDTSHMDEVEWDEGTEVTALTVREALRDAMAEEMRRDEDVFVMGEEVAEYQGAYKVTQGLLDEFGARRVVDTPITEHGFTGIGVGASMVGLKPVVEFMTFNFAMQAIDHIINSAAKSLYMSGGQISCPVVFRGPNGAAARVAAQHSQDYAAWYASVPGLTVVMPHTAADAKGLLKSAIRSPNPVVFLENELLYGKTFDVPVLDDWTVALGKAKRVRKGDDVTLVSWGIGMTYALGAADVLAEQGIAADVLDLRTLRPYDLPAILASVQKTNRCVVVEEAWPQCSQSAEITARIMEQAFDDLDAPVLTVTGKDVPMPYAVSLEKLALPTIQNVVDAALAVTYRR